MCEIHEKQLLTELLMNHNLSILAWLVIFDSPAWILHLDNGLSLINHTL